MRIQDMDERTKSTYFLRESNQKIDLEIKVRNFFENKTLPILIEKTSQKDWERQLLVFFNPKIEHFGFNRKECLWSNVWKMIQLTMDQTYIKVD